MKARGLHSAAATWVEGHATPNDVEKGITTSRDRAFNDQSDLLADKGVASHALGLSSLARVYAFRRAVHLELIFRMQRHTAEVFKAEKAFRDAEANAKRAEGADLICPCLPALPTRSAARRIFPRWPSLSCMPADPRLFMQCWFFLKRIQFAPCGCPAGTPGLTCTQGSSWLELLCAFELMGGCVDDPQREAPRASLRACLKHFTHTCKLVGALCLSISDSIFLKPSKSPNRRLKGIGIANFVPCLNGVAQFPGDIHTQMLSCLVQLKGHLNKSKLAQLRAGTLRVDHTRLVLRGCPAWRKIFKVNVTLPGGADLLIPPDGTHVLTCQPASMSLSCSSCMAVKETAHISLFAKGKWKQLFCSTCYSTSSSRIWSCSCGTAWIGCELHAASGFLCGSRKRRFTPRAVHDPTDAHCCLFTNNTAPPTLDSAPPNKRARGTSIGLAGRQRVPKRRPSIAPLTDRGAPAPRGPSSSSSVRFSSASSFTNRGSKRKSSAPPSRRPKPKAKARSTGLDAVEAFARMQAARANPL